MGYTTLWSQLSQKALLAFAYLLIRVWGMEDGQAREVIRGEQRTAMLDTASSWQSGTSLLIPRCSVERGQIVELVSSSSQQLVSAMYITPPYQLETSTVQVSSLSTTKRLAAFTNDDKFLCYELNI